MDVSCCPHAAAALATVLYDVNMLEDVVTSLTLKVKAFLPDDQRYALSIEEINDPLYSGLNENQTTVTGNPIPNPKCTV